MSERRMVQFLCERQCPQAYGPTPLEVQQKLPIPIWVYWPPVPSRIEKCDGGYVFVVTPESQQEVRERLTSWAVGNVVCEHMGNIIE